MLTTTERHQKRARRAERERARQRVHEQLAGEAAASTPEASSWWSQLARQPPPSVAVEEPRESPARQPQLVGVDGQPLQTRTVAHLIGPDGQPLGGQRASHDDFHEENADVLELLHEEFLDGEGQGPGHGEEGDSCGSARRPACEVADIFRRFAREYRRLYGSRLSVQQDRALRELMVCRTAALVGGYWFAVVGEWRYDLIRRMSP